MSKPPQSENAKDPATAQGIYPGPVEAVTDLDFGRYSVVTASDSTYVLDISPGSSSLIRSPRCHAVGELEAVPLRRDGETVPLLGIIQLQLGRRASFRIDVRSDGIETTRTTTTVRAIERLTA